MSVFVSRDISGIAKTLTGRRIVKFYRKVQKPDRLEDIQCTDVYAFHCFNRLIE